MCGSTQPAPERQYNAGLAKITEHTNAATGFPGRPKTGVPLKIPIAIGLPGFMATRQLEIDP